jgi:hypothetical protein
MIPLCSAAKYEHMNIKDTGMAKRTPQYIKITEFDLRKALRRINESRIEEMVETEIIQHEKYMDELLSDRER